MAYKKLSEQVQELSNPQRSDAFVRLFREAVRRGDFEAAELPERFTMPKNFTRRGAEGTYQRETREMLFESTPEFEAWFQQTDEELNTARRGRGPGRKKASLEAIESGEVDFKTLAAETRQKMQASFAKGQTLGQSRARGGAGGRGKKK